MVNPGLKVKVILILNQNLPIGGLKHDILKPKQLKDMKETKASEK